MTEHVYNVSMQVRLPSFCPGVTLASLEEDIVNALFSIVEDVNYISVTPALNPDEEEDSDIRC